MIQLTKVASTKILDLMTEEDTALRVAVRSGGCSGYQYDLYFDGEADDDMAWYFDGVKVIVDPESSQLLEGATLDYREGLMNSGFVWDNPNTNRSCGCGASFS